MFDQLLTAGVVKLAGGVFVVMAAVRQVLPAPFSSKLGQRFLPLLPLLLGVAGAFLGVTEATSHPDKIMLGMISGFAASHAFKVGKTTVLGWGIEVATPERVDPEQPQSASAKT